jgi:hypothetical protein
LSDHQATLQSATVHANDVTKKALKEMKRELEKSKKALEKKMTESTKVSEEQLKRELKKLQERMKTGPLPGDGEAPAEGKLGFGSKTFDAGSASPLLANAKSQKSMASTKPQDGVIKVQNQNLQTPVSARAGSIGESQAEDAEKPATLDGTVHTASESKLDLGSSVGDLTVETPGGSADPERMEKINQRLDKMQKQIDKLKKNPL